MVQLTLFVICFSLAITIQNTRGQTSELNSLLAALLGSAPSFLYVLGSLVVIPLIKPNLTASQLFEAGLFFTTGACAYEVSQLWTRGQFDQLDLLASILAFVTAVLFYQKCYQSNR